ncbi:MAG TPA: alpha/beta hydrolase [Anaerolineales bacterium]|nr:alpha/beta hydrolase [Anaerolineales bacterium]
MNKTISNSPSAKAIQLQDGRTLGYAEFGSSPGKAIFYFHGHPGSHSEARFLAEQARQSGVRLIGIDRPGMGLSSFKKNRRIFDWPEDVVELADSLQIGRFAVAGFSGGGPYALACAYKIPQRLTACGIVAGVGHINPFLSFLSRWLPWLLLPITRRFFRDEVQAQKMLTRFAAMWAEPDRKSLRQPGIKELLAASLVEAESQGSRGSAYDGALLGRSWGFKPEDIQFPSIYLWHGELDTQVPISIGKATAKSLPHCKATYYPEEGHISLIVNHAEEIVKAL